MVLPSNRQRHWVAVKGRGTYEGVGVVGAGGTEGQGSSLGAGAVWLIRVGNWVILSAFSSGAAGVASHGIESTPSR